MSPGPELFAFEDWLLMPEGGLYHQEEATAVIADVHLGYEWARGKAGDSVPAHSLHETLTRLDSLHRRIPDRLSTLLVAGDLVESGRACRRTSNDVRLLQSWLEAREIEFVRLSGNHDPRPAGSVGEQVAQREIFRVASWTIGHGHRPIPGEKTISGHLHPIFRFRGIGAPCFLVGAERIVLPAFSQNAAGLDVLTRKLDLSSWKDPPRCVVSTGQNLLDFGSLNDLPARMNSDRPFTPVRSRT